MDLYSNYCFNNNRSLLFKQINNSHLDQMNYKLWRKAFNAHAHSYKKSSVKFQLERKLEESWQIVPVKNALTTPFVSQQQQPISDKFCTISMDMNYDDRLFFGYHNFVQFQLSLIQNQCNFDFGASNNKVSINGSPNHVFKLCKMFKDYSIVSVYLEFRISKVDDNELANRMIPKLNGQIGRCLNVYIYVKPVKAQSIQIHFFTHHKNICYLRIAITKVQASFNYCQFGTFSPYLKSNTQIPINRRDITGRNNSYIEQIEKKWRTSIDVNRIEEFQFEKVVITGRDLFSVLKSRQDLLSRFSIELKFQVTTGDRNKHLLVDCISKLAYNSSISLSMEPCFNPSSTAITINSQVDNLDKIFLLRQQFMKELQKRYLSVTNLVTHY